MNQDLPIDIKENWYVIYTYPNSEKKIYNELIKRQITAFFPVKTVIRQWSDRKKKVEVPLFPNYIFVKTLRKKMWTVLLVNGVVKFVSFDGSPVVVKENDVDLVKRLTSETNVVSNESFFIEGEKVQVKEGPFSGLVGKVLSRKGVTRLYVELESVQQILSVDIGVALLSKVE